MDIFCTPLIALTLSILGCYVLYDLITFFNNPLRRFPGPLLASITNYYKAYYDVVKDGGFLEQLENLHADYGPVVRVGPNELHFSDPEAYHEIYYVGSKFTKDPHLYDAFDQKRSSFGLIDPKAAKARRDRLRPFFSRSAILKIENVIQEKVDQLIDRITSYESGTPINLFLAFRATTLDTIMSYCFAENFAALDAPNFAHPILCSVLTSITVIWPLIYLPLLGPAVMNGPRFLINAMFPTLRGYFDLFEHFSNRLDRALADPSQLKWESHETIFHRLLDAPEGDRPDKRSLMDEAITLLGAGSETVGGVLTMGIYQIFSNKDIHRKVVSELDNAFSGEGLEMKYQDLEKLPYLTSVIKESMRLAHGVVSPLPRVVGPSDQQINGHLIPRGTTVSIGSTFLHMNLKIFKNPEMFIPERWSGNDSKSLETKFFVPFSKGPRACLGVNLAWCELYLLFGNIIRHTEISVHNTSSDDFRFRQYWLPIYRGRHLHGVVAKRAI